MIEAFDNLAKHLYKAEKEVEELEKELAKEREKRNIHTVVIMQDGLLDGVLGFYSKAKAEKMLTILESGNELAKDPTKKQFWLDKIEVTD